MLHKPKTLTALIWFFLSTSSLAALLSPLPQNLIAWDSPPGEKLFYQSHLSQNALHLIAQFLTQDNLTYCSIASSVMVLNALNISAPADPDHPPYKFFTQTNFFSKNIQAILPAAKVQHSGATLDEISRALLTYPINVKTIHADHINETQFRYLAKQALAQDNTYIIVNFLRTGLGEQGNGHMSPLAAYDEKSDRFLLLDVARFRYPSVWVKTADLWRAINTIDKDANAYRGFVVVSLKEKNAPRKTAG